MPQSRERQYYKRYIDQATNDIERAMGKALALKHLIAEHYIREQYGGVDSPENINQVLNIHYPQQYEALEVTLQTLDSAIDILKFLRTM